MFRHGRVRCVAEWKANRVPTAYVRRTLREASGKLSALKCADEYHIGAAAFWERLGMHALALVGLAHHTPRVIPWGRVDISDPDHPVLRDASNGGG